MKIVELFKNRFVLLLTFLLLVVSSQYIFTDHLLPTTDFRDLWFYSGIFMIAFSILFIEPYYSSPKNVITNVIPLILVFLSIKQSFSDNILWWISFGLLIFLLLLSIVVIGLASVEQSPTHWRNETSNIIKKTVLLLGTGRIIYSAVFVLFIYLNIVSLPSAEFDHIFNLHFFCLMILWGIVLSVNPEKLTNTFSIRKTTIDKDEIGEIFGIQSKKVFLAKLYKDRMGVKKFDIVKFHYAIQSTNSYIRGIIFDTYLLNQEKWIKVLQLGSVTTDRDLCHKKNAVYIVSDREEKNDLNDELRISSFVGIVVDDSRIGKIRFEYSKKRDDLEEGALLELTVGNSKDGTLKTIYYQVIGGVTGKERLEQRNETGFIVGEALQLGEWVQSELSFVKFGWVPTINTPLFIANTDAIEVPDIAYPDFKLGVIPNTKLPSVINLSDAVRHHLALIGVTGSGKSYLARKIIAQLRQDTKIICVDFTGEWRCQLEEFGPIDLIDSTRLPEVEEEIAKKEMEASGKSPDKRKILDYKRSIQSKLSQYVRDFIESDNSIAMFEIPELSNTTFIMEFTQMFLESIFDYAKKNPGKNICIVLEEAHTVIPETNFLGDLGDYGSSKALVSKMSQIALQGRKYGVGLLVIAQRTANVSKTVLTQCNTVVCFQAFDETSFSFLGNYIGKDMVQTLPNLKQYHAIVTGKAVRSNVPMIVDLHRLD